MNIQRKALVSALVAISLGTSGMTFAQRADERNDRYDRNDNAQRDQRQDRRDDGNRQSDRGNYRGDNRTDYRGEYRGAGPNHNFYRGQRLPSAYHSRYYVVDDWRGHGLNRPPRGYHWVQTGGDYVLVAIASGIIAQLLLGN